MKYRSFVIGCILFCSLLIEGKSAVNMDVQAKPTAKSPVLIYSSELAADSTSFGEGTRYILTNKDKEYKVSANIQGRPFTFSPSGKTFCCYDKGYKNAKYEIFKIINDKETLIRSGESEYEIKVASFIDEDNIAFANREYQKNVINVIDVNSGKPSDRYLMNDDSYNIYWIKQDKTNRLLYVSVLSKRYEPVLAYDMESKGEIAKLYPDLPEMQFLDDGNVAFYRTEWSGTGIQVEYRSNDYYKLIWLCAEMVIPEKLELETKAEYLIRLNKSLNKYSAMKFDAVKYFRGKLIHFVFPIQLDKYDADRGTFSYMINKRKYDVRVTKEEAAALIKRRNEIDDRIKLQGDLKYINDTQFEVVNGYLWDLETKTKILL